MSTLRTATGPAGTLYARATPAPGVVSFRASFPSMPDGAAGEDLTQRLAVRLLDRGTRTRDRFGFAEALEAVGAALTFHSDGLRAGFSGRALCADLPDVLALAAEALAEPLFDPEEVDKARARLDAALRGAEEETDAQAEAALSHALYAPGHPNYERAFADDRARVAALTQEHVASFHARRLTHGPLTLVLAGDVDGLALDSLLSRFDARRPADALPAFSAPRFDAPGRADVPVPGKQSFDVRLGHGVALRRTSADYLAFRAAVFALGGNFSARLMQTVRDVEGLTYGISAGLEGLAAEHDGHIEVGVTLSPENLARGVAATREQLARLLDEGVSGAELEDTTATIGGSHLVGLSTSGGMAAALLHALEDGLGPAYVDALPDRLRVLTPDAVNEALRRHLRPEGLFEVRAGTWTA